MKFRFARKNADVQIFLQQDVAAADVNLARFVEKWD
jgi:hypothetical protein